MLETKPTPRIRVDIMHKIVIVDDTEINLTALPGKSDTPLLMITANNHVEARYQALNNVLEIKQRYVT
jgi:hypothetical protein